MFAAWLHTVARSALHDCWRRRRTFWLLLRNPLAAPDDATTEPDDAKLTEALETALAQLESTDRALLEQKYFSGHDVRSLAAQLEITPKAVESRLTRARAKLRHLLVATLKSHE